MALRIQGYNGGGTIGLFCSSNPDGLSFGTPNYAAMIGNGFAQATGQFSVSGPFLPSQALNDVIDIDIDVDNKKAWISVNGITVQGDPVAGTNPTFTWTGQTIRVVPIYVGSDSGNTIRRIIGSAAFPPPTGYTLA
jgi:hypothetical protein